MKRSEKANRIGKILDDLYPTQPIPLDHKDAYTLLVAVMLSAQTTDKKVNDAHLLVAVLDKWFPLLFLNTLISKLINDSTPCHAPP